MDCPVDFVDATDLAGGLGVDMTRRLLIGGVLRRVFPSCGDNQRGSPTKKQLVDLSLIVFLLL